MHHSKSRIKELSVGDLVTHALYGKEWIGIIIHFVDEGLKQTLHNEKALVQIQPNTKFDGFFKKRVSDKNKVNDNLGFISTNWLFKLEMMKILNLHGTKHSDVDEKVRKFLNFVELPCEIITGNSSKMKKIVKVIIEEYSWVCKEKDSHNFGSLIITEK